MSRSFQVTFDANDTAKLADFWLEALGYQRQPPPPGYETWEDLAEEKGIEMGSVDAVIDPDGVGPRLFFQRVPEGKTAKNRLHLDVIVTDPGSEARDRRAVIDAEVDRLVALGAMKIEDFDDRGFGTWTVMHDPEGNEFCVE